MPALARRLGFSPRRALLTSCAATRRPSNRRTSRNARRCSATCKPKVSGHCTRRARRAPSTLRAQWMRASSARVPRRTCRSLNANSRRRPRPKCAVASMKRIAACMDAPTPSRPSSSSASGCGPACRCACWSCRVCQTGTAARQMPSKASDRRIPTSRTTLFHLLCTIAISCAPARSSPAPLLSKSVSQLSLLAKPRGLRWMSLASSGSKCQGPDSAMTTFDPITLEILWRRLISIVDEADAAVARTAFSSLLRDAHDYTCMFTDRRGRELAQGSFATPGQSGAMALGVKQLVQARPPDSFRPGDAFITNDPWALAGHLNDVCVLSPIFYHDQLTAFTACVLHHADIGGRVASNNHDVFEEGLFIPFVQLYDAGRLNEAVLDLIRWNVRTPEQVIGDIRSQIAANHVCAEQVCRLLIEHQLDGLDDLADEIVTRTERSMRLSIAK